MTEVFGEMLVELPQGLLVEDKVCVRVCVRVLMVVFLCESRCSQPLLVRDKEGFQRYRQYGGNVRSATG